MKPHHLVVFGSDWDVYQYAFRDFIDNPAIDYIPTFRPKGWKGMIQRVHFNPKLNRILPLPFKKAWTPDYLPAIPEGATPCFLILENWLRMESVTHLLPYLRSLYKDATIVCFMQDLLPSIKDLYTGEIISVDYLNEYCNLVVTYDEKEACEQGIAYFPTVFSPLELYSSEGEPTADLYFLGRDKGRLPMLAQICSEAAKRGLRCAFYLLEVPEEQRIEQEGLFYISKPMPYRENLKHVANSKCVVELLQPEARSATFRLWEAIMLNRKLLTVNPQIKELAFYSPEYVATFTNASDVPWDFLSSESAYKMDNPYKEAIRPAALLHFIEEKTGIRIEQ